MQDKQKEERDVVMIESPDPHSIEQETLRMEKVAEFARFSLQLEEKREQSILNQSGQMLTAFSVSSAAMLMAIPILLDYTSISPCVILLSAGIVLAFMIASMVLAVISQWRFKYKTMFNGKELLQKVEADISRHTLKPQYDYQWIDQLSMLQESKRKNNDKRCNLVIASMIAFFTAIACLIVCSFIIACLQ